MLETPILSVLILTHNRLDLSSQYIPKIIDSVGGIPFEVLICDNGSTDGSSDWVYSYGQADCRVHKVMCLDENFGVEAINFIAKEARGKYLLKVDDDVVVPKRFGERLLFAYEKIADSRLAFLGWDMAWGQATFATRSGLRLYKDPFGKIIDINTKERALIAFKPSRWMINGVCRLSRKDIFFALGGHPAGFKYGIDYQVSRAAERQGYWVGFFSPKSTGDLVFHYGRDTPVQRRWKDVELERAIGIKHV